MLYTRNCVPIPESRAKIRVFVTCPTGPENIHIARSPLLNQLRVGLARHAGITLPAFSGVRRQKIKCRGMMPLHFTLGFQGDRTTSGALPLVQDVQDVAVLDDVILALDADPALFLGGGPATGRDHFVPVDGLSTDE